MDRTGNATTGIMHDVCMDGMDNAWAGAMTDIMYGGNLNCDFMLVIDCMFLPITRRDFDGYAADGDKVTDGLPDGSTDKCIDVWTERSFPRFLCFGKFCTGILVGIFVRRRSSDPTN